MLNKYAIDDKNKIQIYCAELFPFCVDSSYVIKSVQIIIRKANKIRKTRIFSYTRMFSLSVSNQQITILFHLIFTSVDNFQFKFLIECVSQSMFFLTPLCLYFSHLNQF